MPPTKKLSPEVIREIIAARGKEPPQDIRKRFGIDTTRLYRIWQEAGVLPAETAENVVPLPPASKQIENTTPAAKQAEKPTSATKQTENTTPAAGVLLPQILAVCQDLQQNMDPLLATQESHYEDVEELGEGFQGWEETVEGILDSKERNSNVVREQTNKIVGAANAATSAAWGVVQVVGIVGGIGSALLLLYTTLRPKYLGWQAAQKTNTAQSPAENTAPHHM